MSGLLGMIGQHLDPNTINQLSSELGTDPATTERAVMAALPNLLGGMAQHANTQQGAAAIHQAVSNAPADGAVPSTSGSGGLLSSILGEHKDATTENVAKASGIDTHQAARVLLALAPIAIAVLSRRHAQDPAATQQPGGLSAMLHGAAAQAASGANANAPGGLGGLLGRFLG